MKKYDQATQAQEKVLDELLELVEVPIPEKLLEDEIKTRKHNLEHHQLGQMGLDLEKYLEIQGKTRRGVRRRDQGAGRVRASRPSSSSTSWSTRRS